MLFSIAALTPFYRFIMFWSIILEKSELAEEGWFYTEFDSAFCCGTGVTFSYYLTPLIILSVYLLRIELNLFV
jgi:hypothetical protein